LEPRIGAPEVIQSAFMPTGDAWQAPVNLSGEGASFPEVAFDGQADAIAVWDSGNATNNEIQSVGYVATGPVLNGVSIPDEGTVGQPVTFSVAPLDVWSIPGETNWSFGDGISASGTSVTHTYTAAGTYEVILHSADTLGNVTSTVSKITIAPAVTPASSPSEPSPGAPASEPPAIGVLSQSASVWHERGRSRVGTTFSISLNEQATVGFSFLRHVNGRMAGRQCLAMTTRNAGRRICSRTVITGAFSFAGHSGMNKVDFQALISHANKLTPGRYTIVITATNATGQRSSPKSLGFTIMG
jgi:PKD repeat protein